MLKKEMTCSVVPTANFYLWFISGLKESVLQMQKRKKNPQYNTYGTISGMRTID